MIVYIDSSALIRSYFIDEPDHAAIRRVITNPDWSVITGSWTRIEVTGALVRAARAHRGDEDRLLTLFDSDISDTGGDVTVIDANQNAVEHIAWGIVRRTGIRALDAWHLACASLAFDELAEPGEVRGFATRDEGQAAVAREMGFTTL